LYADLSPETVDGAFLWVCTIFRAAVADGVIGRSPCHAIKRATVDRPKVVPLAPEVVEQLVAGMPDRYRARVVLGASAGLRLGEALGFTDDRIDCLAAPS
jgi:hypothetical protein